MASFQITHNESLAPVAKYSYVPSLFTSNAYTLPSCYENVFRHVCFLTLHNLIFPTASPVSNCYPRHSHNTLRMGDVPWNDLIMDPSLRFHNLTVLSPLLDANSFSTGENYTSHTPLLCPINLVVIIRFSSQILIDLSWDAVAINLPFGEYLTQLISFSCAMAVFNDYSLV